MRDFAWVKTGELRDAVAFNVRQAGHSTSRVELPGNIKVLCAAVRERAEAFQRSPRAGQLLAEHRNANRSGQSRILKLEGGDEGEV